MQLFLFPHAGGSARSFAGLAGALAAHCQVTACDTPDRGRTYVDPPEALSIQQMAARHAERLARQTGPFAIFGHSMGALAAFETARALRRMGAAPPRLLVLSAHRAPHLDLRRDALHRLDDAAFDARLARYSATPAEVLGNAEMMDLFRPILRRDFAACETYRMAAEPPLDIPALCLGGEDDPDVPQGDLAAWSCHFRTAPITRLLPGGHFYFRDDLPALVAEIGAALSRIYRPIPSCSQRAGIARALDPMTAE